MKTSITEIQPYTTKDGSQIKELMHPELHGNKNQSFALAVVKPGCSTMPHVHNTSEEVYHVTRGKGLMHLGPDTFPVGPGDTIAILPNQSHSIENTGVEPLEIFCCCAPPYSHNDTEICPERG